MTKDSKRHYLNDVLYKFRSLAKQYDPNIKGEWDFGKLRPVGDKISVSPTMSKTEALRSMTKATKKLYKVEE